MRYLKLIVTYDGTEYVGWQRQSNGISIQQRLEEAWHSVTGEISMITSSGRTDAGVHARGQVCSVATSSELDCNAIVRALNARTPIDISVLTAEEAFEGFNAINHSIEKTYCYHIQSGRIHNPLTGRFSWFIPHVLDVAAMNKAASYIVGRQDFSSFQSVGSVRRSPVRNVCRCQVIETQADPFQQIVVEITADGFLYKMVRNIVGTLVPVGRGRKPPEWVKEVIETRDRKRAGQAAPANGLFLDHVVYGSTASKTSSKTAVGDRPIHRPLS